ncbi:MAG: copper chaperone PCu(A)C [Gallionella sp.]|nr:copper chaperone PCu(A)C [Gallionella sp.]
MIKIFSQVLAALTLGFLASNVWANGDIQVKDAWVQAAPPGVKVMAAYLEIKNNGKQQQVLTGVSSPAFGKIEIHRSVIQGNVARMDHLKELTIPANASVLLQQGGLHLMLMDVKKPLASGDQVPLAFIFGNGEKIAATAIVRSGKMEGMGEGGTMDHSGHGGHKH